MQYGIQLLYVHLFASTAAQNRVSYVHSTDKSCQDNKQLGHGRETARRMCRVSDFKRVGHFEGNFRLKGYVSRQYLWTIR